MEVAANNEMDIELESCVGPTVAETRESLPDERAFQVRRRSSSKGSKGSKGSKVKPEDRRNSSFEQECESLEEAAWAKFDDSLPDFFQVLEFAKDGGFSEVHELWDSSRYLRAVLALMMLMANVGTIVINDGGYLVHATHLADEQQEDTLGIHPVDDHVRAIQNDYMISGFLVDGCFLAFASLIGCDHGIHSPRIALICAIELLLLALLLVKAVACFVASFVEKLERVRWSKAYIFWWEVLPELTSFSAMRLLHFATPSVVLSDLYSFAAYAGSRAELDGWATGARLWVVFVLTKLMCLVLGIDAFLFKVRVAYSDIHQEELGPWSLLSVTMFIVQVLGIVQLSMFVRGRIFLFIFGGEDSIMQPAEKALQNIWQAMVVRKVCQLFDWPKAAAILMTFDEDDFQKLVLNENGDIHESLMSTSVGSWDPIAESAGYASESLLSRISEDDKEGQ
mmetsp:Transcript_44962/g.71457  ORF Transcript_44962/g.71457 Transcript_44962/m.71457 type:complete len:452 (+) Transcript_44962:81-1436(+)